jgi:hypothetical protein
MVKIATEITSKYQKYKLNLSLRDSTVSAIIARTFNTIKIRINMSKTLLAVSPGSGGSRISNVRFLTDI